ncbi:tryptophan tryptophylquinone biosynthesis enzyme MauG [Betaproteobacteria bacterium GR16-43]|nr:tryptophan tryptophylquinone biosynthesis enzyme MauG [Betaproteobacteria bacterium GR16-43]
MATSLAALAPAFASDAIVDAQGDTVVVAPGHASLQKWLLPETAPSPADNVTTPERVALGKKLFFDPRLSGTGRSSCATCHLPERGWSDGYPKSIRFMGEVMTRASPTLVNTGYNTIQQWDGRSPTLEHQAANGMSATGSMNGGSEKPVTGVANIGRIKGYVDAFERAYPGEPLNVATLAKAISAFERSIVSRNSPFDRWVRGDATALTAEQVRGFRVFIDPAGGNCSVCHAPPNFTDNGFHNLGLMSFGEDNPDVGRFKQRPVALLKGAFKTPTLRDVALSAPYFHDGSARNLREVVDHYVTGGQVRSNLSPNMRPLALGPEDRAALVAFMEALTTPTEVFVYPVLPP